MKNYFSRLASRIIPILFIILFCYTTVFGQADSLANLRRQFDRFQKQSLQEKVFVHTDRSVYLVGELIWFKTYVADGIVNKPLHLSKVVYLEVLDKDKKPVIQTKVAVEEGSGNGSLFLPASLQSGNYLVRAYTNWMKNFDPGYYFEKPVTIINTFRRLGLKPVEEKNEYDIRFFPEGGNLVRNIGSKVAFKVVDKNNKGINFKGYILDQSNDTVVRFSPLKFGIGHFTFTPLQGKEYKAIIVDTQGAVFPAEVPDIYDTGYVMQLEDGEENQVRLTVKSAVSSNSVSSTASFVYLLCHTRQVVKIAEKGALRAGEAVFTIDKSKLGEGISHFTVFNSDKQPVCERLYYKQPTQLLVINANTNQSQYRTREQVNLELLSSNTSGNPEMAGLSISVYKLDSLPELDAGNILSYLWLTSDLKGYVESPAYYFQAIGNERDLAIDNLLLTHGWRRFRWEDVLKTDTLSYRFIPEYAGHIINGKVSKSGASIPAADITTYLTAPGNTIRLYPSKSDESGQVTFEMKDFYGPKEIIVQTNNRVDSVYHFEIFSPYSEKFSAYKLPEFTLSEASEDPVLSRSISMQVQNAYLGSRINQLHFPKTDTAAFYGKPDQHYLLDNYTRFPVLEEVMREYVPGVSVKKRKGKFYFEVLDYPHKAFFQHEPLVLLDGVPIFDTDQLMAFDPLKIKKLEVMNRKYSLGGLNFDGVLSYATYKGNLAGFQLDPRVLVMEYEGLQLKREFYSPKYDSEKQLNSRQPDLRTLLYWNPDIKTNSQGKQHLEFFTSDQEGAYVGVVQGITKEGKVGYQTLTFEVKNLVK